MRTALVLTACLLLVACENAEERARYVKTPLETADLTDRRSLEDAVREARTRLVAVRSPRLRADLSLDIDGTYERALAHIREREEAERQALEAERRRREERRLEAERRHEEERKREESPPEPSQAGRRRAAVAAQLELARDAVTAIEAGVRDSAFGDGTKVLVLRNPKPHPATFELRCVTADDAGGRTFALAIPAHGEKRIGFLQGWSGNFTGGERCEAYVDGEQMWQYTVPR